MNSGLFSNPLPNHGPNPGAAQVWVKFDGTSGRILASHNVASVTRNGLGDYTVRFLRGFINQHFAVSINAKPQSNISLCCTVHASDTGTNNSKRIQISQPTVSSADGAFVDFVAYGELA